MTTSQLSFKDPARFINRELSWLAFNQRVLEEAQNPDHPLLERLRFLSISGSNLDEFFMVRVAGLAGQVREDIIDISQDGLTPKQQLEQVRAKAAVLMHDQDEQWQKLHKELAQNGIEVIAKEQLKVADKKWLDDFFLDQILPVVTPIAIDPAHPFPFMQNRGFVVVLELKRKKDQRVMKALLPIPAQLKRFYQLPKQSPEHGLRFISLENMLASLSPQLFPGYEVIGEGVLRIIRDSDIEIMEEAEDLVLLFESALRRRRRGSVIRLEVNADCPASLRDFMASNLDVEEEAIVICDGLVGYEDTRQLIVRERTDLTFPPFNARFPERIRSHGGDCFAAIR